MHSIQKRQQTHLLAILIGTTLPMLVIINFMCLILLNRFLSSAVECGKRSPELIQLLDMHMHFSSATPGIRVSTCSIVSSIIIIDILGRCW